MKTIQLILILFAVLWSSPVLLAQENKAVSDSTHKKDPDKKPLLDRLVFGITPNVRFGTQTFIELSPYIGYKIAEPVQVGIGGTFMYQSIRYMRGAPANQTYAYGLRPYARAFPFPFLFAHAEYEMFNSEYYDALGAGFTRTWISSGLVGIGYRSSGGGRLAYTIMGLYNLNYNPNVSPYPSPFVFRASLEF